MDNYIALIEALSGFTPETVTIEVFPGFESITGGGDSNILSTQEGNVNVLGGQSVEDGQSFGVFSNAGGDQTNVGGNYAEGDYAEGNLAQGDQAFDGGVVGDEARVTNGEGDIIEGNSASGTGSQNVEGGQALGAAAQNVAGNQAISGTGDVTGGDVDNTSAAEGSIIGDSSTIGDGNVSTEGDVELDNSDQSQEAGGLLGTTGGTGGLFGGQTNTIEDFLNPTQDNDFNGLEILGGGLLG